MPARRTILRSGGAVAVGTLAGLVVVPSPQESSEIDRTVDGARQFDVERDAPDAITPWLARDEPIDTEDVAPIARYQYRMADGDGDDDDEDGPGDGYASTAPINVVLAPEAGGLERVMSVLVDAGWALGPEEYTRFAWDREREQYRRQQATAAETYYGTSGRLHVRCWEFEDVVSMQAHEDTGARPKHGVASYERGRRAIESIYASAGWRVATAAIDLGNAQHDHDGDATVITDVPSASAPAEGSQ